MKYQDDGLAEEQMPPLLAGESGCYMEKILQVGHNGDQLGLLEMIGNCNGCGEYINWSI